MNEQLRTYHNVHEWDIDDVKNWLIEKGFSDNICELFETHKIDGKALLTLREDDLKNSLQINCLGEIKKLYLSISHLQTINFTFYSKLSTNTFLDLNNINYLQLKEQLKIELLTENNNNHFRKRNQHSPNNNREKIKSNYQHLNDDQDTTSIESIPEDISELDDDNDLVRLRKKFLANGKYQEFKPEVWKAVVAMIYFFVVTWITAIVMVIVHDRVPDMTKYPPLPDIFLDNVPLIPHSFKICELIGLILFIISSILLVFHKHRFILIRRMFSLFGSVFLLRCVTMLITSLSVPGRHLNCKARPYGDWQDKLKQAYLIWQGAGMSIQGVRTCGDYMFSGHTVTLTLLNFFITEYTPTSFYFVHTLSWVLNLFGIFFILAGHEHYSIDVFIAFYITTRLFLYYHTLANNRCLYSGDRKRTRYWYPLFYFFESSVNGIVPNEFEIPFRNLFKWTNRNSILNHSNSTDQLINDLKNQSKQVIKSLKKEFYNYPKINGILNGVIRSSNSNTELNNCNGIVKSSNSSTELNNFNGNSINKLNNCNGNSINKLNNCNGNSINKLNNCNGNSIDNKLNSCNGVDKSSNSNTELINCNGNSINNNLNNCNGNSIRNSKRNKKKK